MHQDRSWCECLVYGQPSLLLETTLKVDRKHVPNTQLLSVTADGLSRGCCVIPLLYIKLLWISGIASIEKGVLKHMH